MFTAKVRTAPLGQLLRCERARRLDDLTFAMHPMRLDAIEPRASAGQVASDDANARALLLDGLVVHAQPVAHLVTDMPRGIVPDHQQRLFAQLATTLTAPSQVLGR